MFIHRRYDGFRITEFVRDNRVHVLKLLLITLLLGLSATAGCISSTEQPQSSEDATESSSFTSVTKVEAIHAAPEARFGAVAFNIQEKIFLIGGINLDSIYLPIKEYDPATNKWHIGSTLPTPRFGFAAVELDEQIYTIGGRNDTSVLSVVERYDPNSDSWKKLSNLPTGRWNLMAAAVGDRIYTIGGITGIGDQRYSVDLVEVYDPVRDEWTELDRAPFRRSGASTAVLFDNIFVIGGRPEAGGATSITGRVDKFNPTTQAWDQASPLSEARTSSCVVSTDDKIYVIAGGGGPFEPLASVELYDLEAEEWTTIGSLNESRSAPACIAIGNNIYVMGGAISQSPPLLSKTIESIKISP